MSERNRNPILTCAVCKKEIEGEPFTLSDLSENGNLLDVCRKCAGSQWITLKYDKMELTVFRDDYIRSDKRRLDAALNNAVCALDELGWACKAMKIEGSSDIIAEEYEE